MTPRSVDSSLDSAIVARTSNPLDALGVKSPMCVRGDFLLKNLRVENMFDRKKSE
jgi:hypothetical protein